MLMLNRSLLSREYILMNVLKAALIVSLWNLHVIFLLKIAPRWFTLSKVKVKVIFTTDGHLASLSWFKHHRETVNNFSFLFYLKLSLDGCWFYIMERPLWREDGSVIYSCYYTLPAQSSSGPSSAELMTKFHWLLPPGRASSRIYFPSGTR
jgi:hypothetical protein